MPQVGDILHLPTGIYVDKQVLFDQAARSRVVFVGETHDNPASHRLQLRGNGDAGKWREMGTDLFSVSKETVPAQNLASLT